MFIGYMIIDKHAVVNDLAPALSWDVNYTHHLYDMQTI